MNLERVADYDYKRFWFMLKLFYRREKFQGFRYDFLQKIFADKVYSENVKELLAYYIHNLINGKNHKFPIAEIPQDSNKYRTSNFYSFYEALKWVDYNRNLQQETLKFIHKHSSFGQRVLFLFTNKVNRLSIPINKLEDIFIELDMQKYIIDNPEIKCGKPKTRQSKLDLEYPMLVLPMTGKWVYYHKYESYYKTNADGELYDILSHVANSWEYISIEGLFKNNKFHVYIATSNKGMTQALYEGKERYSFHKQPYMFVQQFKPISNIIEKLRIFQQNMPTFEVAQGKVVTTVEGLLNSIEKGTYTLVNKKNVLRNIIVEEPVRKMVTDFVMGECLVLGDEEFSLENFVGNKRDLSKLVGQYLVIYKIKDKILGRVE